MRKLARPPSYKTSDQVRAGISVAYSGIFNSRGLEKIWYGPYGHMFAELASQYNGHLIAHCQYPLWILSLKASELMLREEFKKYGLDYDESESPAKDTPPSPSESINEGVDDILADLDSVNLRPRSERIIKLNAQKALANVIEEQNRVKDLFKRREALYQVQSNSISNPDFSTESAMSQPDAGAIDEEPDFVLSHVAHFELSEPTEDAKYHYMHRAGVKVFHQCCPLIAEIKVPPPRFFQEQKRRDAAGVNIRTAIEDMMEYCSAYFQCHPESASVIAFVAAGPFWTWANVSKDNAPIFDWKVKRAEHPKAIKFVKLFGTSFFVLGTHESDQALSRISQDYIWPMLQNGHYKVGRT